MQQIFSRPKGENPGPQVNPLIHTEIPPVRRYAPLDLYRTISTSQSPALVYGLSGLNFVYMDCLAPSSSIRTFLALAHLCELPGLQLAYMVSQTTSSSMWTPWPPAGLYGFHALELDYKDSMASCSSSYIWTSWPLTCLFGHPSFQHVSKNTLGFSSSI